MKTAWFIKYNGKRVSAVELYRKHIHQLVVMLNGDLGPFKHGDAVLINLFTKEVTLIEEYIQ